MKAKEHVRLQIPQGTEGFYLEEAVRHRRLVSAVGERFYRWGYLPVQTPAMDFFDVYRPLLTPAQEKLIYRLIDRDGELLMLRSDATLFLAKQMGMVLTREDLPARVFYTEPILRHENPEDISHNEFFQVGAELIGAPGREGDLEALLLLSDIIGSLPTEGSRFHVGSRKLVQGLLGSASDLPGMIDAVLHRRSDEVEEAFARGGQAPGVARRLSELLSFIGSPSELADRLEREQTDKELPATVIGGLSDVSELVSTVERLSEGAAVIADLSEIGTQPYHSGTAFRVYCPGADSAVAAGGRYDGLLGNFGFDAPSVGFSVMLRKIEALSKAQEETGDRPEKAPGGSFEERYRASLELRERGKRVVLS